MAKVYSWQIQKNPAIYAYIVNPLEVNKTNPNAYVGTELNGVYLENIKKWVKDCTIDVYKTQFEKMKTLCITKGYKVDFENPETYFNVVGECDNLRGPAGRGIKYIGLKASSSEQNEYIVYYDDDTTYTFTVLNGINGKDGKNGEPGARGDSGVSSKIIMIYKSADKRPDKPEGGSYNFETNTFVYPEGWNTVDASTLVPPVWMSSRTFTTSAISTDIEWSIPVQITGENGEPGADGTSIEFLYILADEEPNVYSLESPNTPGYEPPVDSGWTNHPSGVNENKTTEWCTTRRTTQDENGKTVWGPWEKAFIWSKYGTNGQDGDGVQYIFLKNTGEIPLNPTPENYNNVDSEIYKSYQNKNNEWIPESNVEYRNFKGQTVKYVELDDNVGIWTDNPTDITPIYHSQWVCVRKYTKNENGRMEWGAYSEPALWGRYGQEGKSATSVRKLYALSNSTSEPPTLPSDSTITGDWGSGFPVDYVAGENVVWGTEAEIWSKDNTFVYSYKAISSSRPSDAKDNDIYTVSTLPETEIPGYKYVCVNDKYYQWTGGWCKPYLVTGLKGEPGSPIDYTIYVFAFARADKTPLPPNGTKDAPGRVNYDDATKGDYWVDFPDTSGGKIDGVTNNGHIMRWYQCIGYVHGHDNSIKEWGKVYPCNGQDGTPGRYTEFRFAVTKNQTAPNIIQFDSNGNVYRIPKLKNEKGEEINWVDTDENLPQIPTGGAMWQIWATIDNSNNEEKVINKWNGPRRVSGEQGPQGERGPEGLRGPAGLQGATGLPGAGLIQMYCLGTYGANGDYYFDTYEEGSNQIGDGYFGSEIWKDEVTVENMTDWYEGKNMPLSSVIEVYSLDDLTAATNNENMGRVIKYTKVKEKTSQYYLVTKHKNGDANTKKLTPPLSEDVDFNIYVWCIQGTEIKNDEGLTGVKWGKPFKLQGTNGLRGLSGQRGQVVYPMGVYNPEEVYITTEDKAPYVYDPQDGMFYVYNIVNEPWVGSLPENYKNIMVHPTDINNNYEDAYVNPEGYTFEVTSKKYLRFEDKYYIWDNKLSKYVLASKYKYSSDGSGHDGTWISDQDGQTPADNYANLTNDSRKPAWVRFESFQALYTSIGIIANGMIGSAVYNNEFMFSQQGIDQYGKITNYAVVNGENTEYGFLSGYEYDENGKEINGVIRHWKYRNTETYIDNTAVNPYETIENDGKNEYIHTFMPNVCINFATGQMWLSTGKISFGTLGETNIYTKFDIEEKLKEINNKLNEIEKDNQICADEQDYLIAEKTNIENDYKNSNEIIDQANELEVDSIYIDDYKNAYNPAIAALEKYTKPLGEGKCITIEDDYKYISNYYTKKDILIQQINLKLPEIVANFKVTLTDFTSTVEGHKTDIKTLKNNVSGLTNQIITIEKTTTSKIKQTYDEITAFVDSKQTETDGNIKTINDTVSEIKTKVNGIELKVGGTVSVGVVNLIDRTEFESIEFIKEKNDDSKEFNFPPRKIIGEINVNPKTNDTYSNSLYLDATDYTITNGPDTQLYLDATQNLTGKLKSNTTYTLHCKYKTIKDLQQEPAPINENIPAEPSTTPVPGIGVVHGGLYIENVYPSWMEVDGEEIPTKDIPSNLKNLFETNTTEWETRVVKFTTTKIDDNIITLYIRAMMGYYVEIADLKLEEGNTPSTWSKSPQDISTKFSQIKMTSEEIRSEVKNITVGGQNLLDRTEFEIEEDGSTKIFDNDIKDTKSFQLQYGLENHNSGYNIEKTSDDIKTNILQLNCKGASDEKDSIKVTQNLTGAIKSKTTYTLHCKYKTAYVPKFNVNGGSFGIEGVKPSWVNINGNDISGLSNNAEVILPLKNLSEWNSLVIKFTTGVSLSDTVSFSVKANASSCVEICELKLEEGKVPTSWSTSPKDVSSQIKQTADSISLTVSSLTIGSGNLLDRTEFESVENMTVSGDTKNFKLTYKGLTDNNENPAIYINNVEPNNYTNSLVIDTTNTSLKDNSDEKYINVEQVLTNVIKPEKSYTLYCKYKTNETNEGNNLFLELGQNSSLPTSLEIDNEKITPTSKVIQTSFGKNVTDWKEKIIKFTTGENVDTTVKFHIRANKKNENNSIVEICDLKLEEGKLVSNTWVPSQKEISRSISQIKQTADSVTLEVKNLTVGGQNLLDRTEFETEDGTIDKITNTKDNSTKHFELKNRNLSGTTCAVIDKTQYDFATNILSINAKNASYGDKNTSEYFTDIVQTLNKVDTPPFKTLKKNTTYTLHCKYRTTYQKHTISNTVVSDFPGALFITNANAKWKEVEGGGNGRTVDLYTPLHTSEDWKNIIISFTTGDNLGEVNDFIIRTYIGCTVEICELKLEEGKIPTAWSVSPKDTSSQIKQTADSISLSVTSEINDKTGNIENKLRETGINIEDGIINLNANKTIINGNLNIRNSNEGLIIYDDNQIQRIKIQNTKIPNIDEIDKPIEDSYFVEQFNIQRTNGETNFTSDYINIGTLDVGDEISLRDYINIKKPFRGDGNIIELNEVSQLYFKYEIFNEDTETTIFSDEHQYLENDSYYGLNPVSETFKISISEKGFYKFRLHFIYKYQNTDYRKYELCWKGSLNRIVTNYTLIGTDGFTSTQGAGNHFYYGVDGLFVKRKAGYANATGLKVDNSGVYIMENNGLWYQTATFTRTAVGKVHYIEEFEKYCINMNNINSGCHHADTIIINGPYDRNNKLLTNIDIWVVLPTEYLHTTDKFGQSEEQITTDNNGRIIRIKNMTTCDCYVMLPKGYTNGKLYKINSRTETDYIEIGNNYSEFVCFYNNEWCQAR